MVRRPMLHDPRVRFVLVGAANTLIDMGALVVLTRAELALFWANMISTTIALAFSFSINRRVTFRATSGKPLWRQGLEFLVVTLTGLWLIQPPLISAVQQLIGSLPFDAKAGLLVGKVVATGVTLVWNYVFYSRVVFATRDRKER